MLASKKGDARQEEEERESETTTRCAWPPRNGLWGPNMMVPASYMHTDHENLA